jgi:DNA-binding MarR family transcriptional regulator
MQAPVEPLTAEDQHLVRDLGGFMKYLLGYGASAFFQAVADLDLSLSQIRALHTLVREPEGASLGDVAEHTGLSLPTASRVVDSLVQRGLATRVESPSDRRVRNVAATGEARELAARLIELRLAGLEEFARSLTPDERRMLGEALAPIVAREEIAPMCVAEARRDA